jgi:serine/threonine-protein kinase
VGTLSDIEADWPVIDRLLDEAMALPATERETWLASLAPEVACHRDTLRELLALKAQVETEHFMDAMPVFPGLATLRTQGVAGGSGVGAAPAAGQEVGPYRLLRLLGEGGMGAVWLAERADGTLKRKVALKLPRLAWSQDLASRMARERDILAPLEHPNIARLYDAGVDVVGRPWLALEFVEGSDLASFCDTARLDLRARVRLFLQVLSAVQYAHGSLVIHRDLKPANILVTPQGEARLLDFGIARLEEGAADAGPALTRDGRGAMTPRYASPEQVRGGRLTVASDLYSLGVVLHEMLTGETPYVLRRESRAEYEQAIVESDLRVPSRLKVTEVAAAARGTTPERIAHDLRGDLDAVLLRALAPAPEARYASAAALRDDLERWLEGRPVSAVPPSRTYALRKFIARNRLAVAASAAAALALVAISVVAMLQAQRAERSAAAARAAAARSDATKDLVLSIIRDADKEREKRPGSSIRELVAAQLDVRLSDQPKLRGEILEQMLGVYSDEGDLVGAAASAERLSMTAIERGDIDQAIKALISEAYYAMAMDDHAAARSKLDRIGAVVDVARLPASDRVAVHDLEALIAKAAGDLAGAAARYELMIAAARAAGDDGSLFAALTSRMQARASTDGTAAWRSDLLEAERLLAKLPADSRATNRVFLVSVLLRMGVHREGWKRALQLLKQHSAVFSKTDYLSRSANGIWLDYCVVVGRPELAQRWLRELEAPRLAPVLRSFERDPSWRMRVAQVHAASHDWSSARREIEAAKALLGSPDARLSATEERVRVQLALAQASVAMKQGFAQRTPGTFSALPVDLRDPPTPGPQESHRWAWLRGLKALGSGRARDAVDELTVAARRARTEMGESHPDLARIALALVVAHGRAADGAPDGDTVALLRRADTALRAALPAPHPILAYLDALKAPTQGADAAARAARRAAAVPFPDFLVP